MANMSKKVSCPLNKFKKCKEFECSWYIQVQGINPQTGIPVDEWGCAVGWLPILLIENSQQQRSTGAAVESFRNEVVKANRENQELFSQNLGIDAPPKIIADNTKLEGK